MRLYKFRAVLPVARRVSRAMALFIASGLLFSAACAQSGSAIRTEIVAKGLEHPWTLAFINGGRMLVTERPGRLRMVEPTGEIGPPIEGLPPIDAGGQGGLLDVIVDTRFTRNRTIYFCYSEPGESGNSTALASARLSEDARRLEQVKVLFSQRPKVESSAHFGCRIVERNDGTLFLTMGDRYSRKEDAQILNNHIGKIVRIRKDGTVPPDNPFAGKAASERDAAPEIWSYGHRNVQGATLGPNGELWAHEHGPQGGDEINQPQAGKNYGWPVITYGENYGGGKIGEGITAKAGMEQPVYYWTPSIAPSGMTFLRSDRYGKSWQRNLFVGALKSRYLVRLELRDGKVVHEERLLRRLGKRIRDVREGPDGLLYILTDERNGRIIRLGLAQE